MVRLLCELVIILALVALGWQKSFHEWVDQARGGSKSGAPEQQSARRALPANAAASRQPFNAVAPVRPRSGADQPAYDNKRSFTGHVFYKDEQGKTYWIDGAGRRHYQP